jgi:hypothetical protein
MRYRRKLLCRYGAVRAPLVGLTFRIILDKDKRAITHVSFTFPEKYKSSEPGAEFQCCPGFISNFKQRNRVSSQRAHMKCRPIVTIEDHEHWIRSLIQLLQDVPRTDNLHVDHLYWRVDLEWLQTWTANGSQTIGLLMQ